MGRYYKVINDDTGEECYVKFKIPIYNDEVLEFCKEVIGFDCNRVEIITKEEFENKHKENLLGGHDNE